LQARGGAAIVFDAVGSFLNDDGWAIASHIALSTLTSLFPFLIFVTTVAGFFGSQDLSNEAAQLIFGAWPAAVAKPIAAEVENVLTSPHGGLLTFSAVFALYFASSAIEALRTGLNRAYDLVETRPWWLLRLQSIAFVAVASLALLVLAFLVVLGPLIWSVALEFAPQLESLHRLVTLGRLAIATIALGISLLLAHRWLPAKRPTLLEIAPGVALTFVTSIGFGELFGIYLSEYARNYVVTYAGLASVMVALVFLYMIAAIFVFGGEFNAAIMRARAGGRKRRV
jgi:membrane protein